MSENKVCTCKGLHTIECVINKCQNEGYTVLRSAELAGISRKKMEDELRERGITPYRTGGKAWKKSLDFIESIS